jgi:hypothetical protein
MAAAGPAGAGGGGPVWPRKDEFLRLKQQTQKMVLLSDVEVDKEYYLMFGYNPNPLFSFNYSLATCVRDLGGPNNEKEFTGDIVDGDGNIVSLGHTFRIDDRSVNIFIFPPPNEGTGASREQHPRPEWNGGSGGTASRKKSRKLKRKNRKSRKNRR